MQARAILASLPLFTLLACATPRPALPLQPPSAACVGYVQEQEGLREVPDPELLRQALGFPGKGSLCTARVFEAVRPVTVYRVWNKAKPYTQLGRWWSFAAPKGPVAEYRRDNAICPEWSALDVVSACKLKVGARVVVGPGQSAECKDGTYPASATNQVFVPNDTRDPAKPSVHVEACTEGAPWP